jgi:hypothetical protein
MVLENLDLKYDTAINNYGRQKFTLTGEIRVNLYERVKLIQLLDNDKDVLESALDDYAIKCKDKESDEILSDSEDDLPCLCSQCYFEDGER